MPVLRPMPAAVLSAAVLAVPALAVLLVGSTASLAAERSARARLCPEDLPEGVRLPPSPGCDGSAPQDRSRAKLRDDGFLDLGDGTTVRIGGRAGAEFGARR